MDTKEQEYFVPVKGYEDHYLISNLGTVKAEHRIVKRKDGFTQTHGARILKQGMVKGYKNVGLCKNGKPVSITVHKIMAETFLGVKTSHLVPTDHINGIPTDNRLSNLRVVPAYANSANHRPYKTNTSSRTGVYWHKRNRKWWAQITRQGKYIYIGQFKTFQEAVAAREKHEQKFWNRWKRKFILPVN